MKQGEGKKNRVRVKRQISIITVFLWIFLVTTMITITTSSIKNKNAVVEIDDDNWNIELVMYDKSGDIQNKSITEATWNAISKDEEKELVMQVNYNFMTKKEYQPGDIIIQIPGIGKDSFSEYWRNTTNYDESYEKWLKDNVAISADDVNNSTKYYDFSYIYDSENNLYTFTNNNIIEENKVCLGTIQVAYNLKPRFKVKTDLEFKAILKENVTNVDEIIKKESNICNFHYTATKESYTIKSSSAKMKLDFTNREDLLEKYYWNVFSVTGNDIDGIIKVYGENNSNNFIRCTIENSVSMLYDKDFNRITPKKIDSYKQEFYYLSRGENNIYYIATPKTYSNSSNTISVNIQPWGRYEDTDNMQQLYRNPTTWGIMLWEYNKNYDGKRYIMEKSINSTSNIYANQLKNNNKVKLDYSLDVTSFYPNNIFNIEIGDDLLYIARENGELTKLDDNEYNFSEVKIPILYTYNIYTKDKGEPLIGYNYEVQVRYKNTDEFVKYKEGITSNVAVNSYDGIQDRIVFSNEDIVGVKIIIKNLDKTVYNALVQMSTDIYAEKFLPGGEIYTFSYFKVYRIDKDNKEINILDTSKSDYDKILSETGIDVSAYDIEKYNKSLVRRYGKTIIDNGFLDLTSLKLTSSLNNNLKDEKYEVDYTLDTNFNLEYYDVNKDFVINQYDILPSGMNLCSNKDEIINSIETNLPYQDLKLKDGTIFNSREELDSYIKSNTNVYIDYNYKESKRAKIIIKYNLNDIDWNNYKTNVLSGNINAAIKTEVPYDSLSEFGSKYTNYMYAMWNNQEYGYSDNSIKDDGSQDVLANDLDEDGNTEEMLEFSSNTLNIIYAISSKQTVTSQVRTDLTKGAYVEGTTEASIGSKYTYKLRVTTGANRLKDLIIYDTLETIVNATGEEITEGWKGEFLGVNTEHAVSKGYAPKVYYSEEKYPGKLTEVPDKWKDLNDDVDKTKVKSICIDLRYKADGSEMELSSNDVIFILVEMMVPNDESLTASSHNMFSVDWKTISLFGETVDKIEEVYSNETSIELSKVNIKKDISGFVTWEDENNKYELRPESVTVKLLQDGQEYESKEVTVGTQWSYTFENVPVYKNNTSEYEYEIVEEEVQNYKTTYDGYNITNSIKVKDIEVTKIWNDNENEANKRPDSVILQVYDSDVLINEAEVNEITSWKHTFTNLLKYRDNGEEINYTVNEKSFVNDKFYVKEINGNTITNTFTVPEDKISIIGTKIWEDANNRAGKRPDSIILQVKENGVVVTEQEVTANDNWSYEFELAKYDNLGNERIYIIDEKDTGSKFYQKELTNSTTVTNRFEVPNETVQVEVVKIWNDNNNESQKRPESIKLQVKAGGAVIEEVDVNEETEWKRTFTLPKYDSLGDEIEYTVDEDFVNEFYVKSIVGNKVTNTFTVPTDKVTIVGTKVWDDLDNFANKREKQVTLQLIGDNEVVAEQIVTADNNWSYEFEVPKYDRYGNEIEYHIDEKDTLNKFYQKELTNATTVTNIFEVPNEKKSIEVINVWDDNENEAQKRPTSIRLQVKRNGVVIDEFEVNSTNNWQHIFEVPKYDERGDEIEYTVDEDFVNEFYVKSIVGNVITNTFTVPEDKINIIGTKVWQDNGNAGGKREDTIVLQLKNDRNEVVAEGEVNDRNNWSYEFEALKYDRLGNEVTYHIDERNTNNKFYEKELTDSTTVTNRFVVPDEKVIVKAVKVWEDNNNNAGKRLDSVTLQIYNKNVKVAEKKVTEEDNWSFEAELTRYDELGDEITYTVNEKETSKFYEKEVVGNIVTNRFIVPDEKINIEAIKKWEDNENESGKRPNSVILQIKRDGVVIEECEVSSTNEWKHTFTLSKYSDLGNEIEYTVDEKETSKFYEKEINGNIVSNRFSVPDEKVEIEVEKKWEDNNNEELKRPESIKLQVKLKGEVVDEFEVTKKEDFKHKFILPKYDNLGNELRYTVDEDFYSEFYVKEIVENIITNKFVVPEDKIKIVGTKIWEDENNKAGKRPESVILQLKVEDEVISEAEVNESNNWSYEFEAVKYDNLGNEKNYYIDEKINENSNNVENKFYIKELTGKNTVTNRFAIPDEKIIINAKKIWKDSNNKLGKRPDSVTLQVKSGDNVISEAEVNEACNWSYDFEVPKYDELGNEISYVVDEKETVLDYIKELTGTTVINTLMSDLPNTSDINVLVYVIVFFIAVIVVIFIRKNKNK